MKSIDVRNSRSLNTSSNYVVHIYDIFGEGGPSKSDIGVKNGNTVSID